MILIPPLIWYSAKKRWKKKTNNGNCKLEPISDFLFATINVEKNDKMCNEKNTGNILAKPTKNLSKTVYSEYLNIWKCIDVALRVLAAQKDHRIPVYSQPQRSINWILTTNWLFLLPTEKKAKERKKKNTQSNQQPSRTSSKIRALTG